MVRLFVKHRRPKLPASLAEPPRRFSSNRFEDPQIELQPEQTQQKDDSRHVHATRLRHMKAIRFMWVDLNRCRL